MAQADETTTQVHSKRFKVLLGVSLGLNLAVLGVVAGTMLRDGPHSPPRGDRGGQISFARPYMQALPREDRRAIFEAARSGNKGAGRATRRAHYQEVLGILRADSFDRAGVEAVLVKQAASTLDVQNAGQMQWLNVIEAMDLEERGAYADAIAEVLARKAERKSKPNSAKP